MQASPWLIHRPGNRADLIVLCDHAGNQIPTELDSLGLAQDQLQRHIGWDPGALGVAQAVAESLSAELLGWNCSRLVTDPNRAPDHADLILARSDDTFVPGNEELTERERKQRLRHYHQPYHEIIEASVSARLNAGQRPLLVSIHSFEPMLVGVRRPWPIGVLWKQAREPLAGVIDALASQGHAVGDNQPYDGRVALGYTLERHAIERDLPHVLFELRNDLLGTAETQAHWADCIVKALGEGGLLS